jgi:hypothetical protein
MNVQSIIGAAVVFVAACGGGGLAREDVADLPPGGGQGASASGSYDIELYTRSCSGKCSIEVDGFTFGLCDVGEVDTASLEVTQTDGRLVMDADGLVLDRLSGGIEADGGFTVGGWGTEEGGAVEVRVLSTGSLTGAVITGTAETRAVGSYEGESVDCTAIFDVTGARL